MGVVAPPPAPPPAATRREGGAYLRRLFLVDSLVVVFGRRRTVGCFTNRPVMADRHAYRSCRFSWLPCVAPFWASLWASTLAPSHRPLIHPQSRSRIGRTGGASGSESVGDYVCLLD